MIIQLVIIHHNKPGAIIIICKDSTVVLFQGQTGEKYAMLLFQVLHFFPAMGLLLPISTNFMHPGIHVVYSCYRPSLFKSRAIVV